MIKSWYATVYHLLEAKLYSQIVIRNTPIFVVQQETDRENLITTRNLEPFHYSCPTEDWKYTLISAADTRKSLSSRRGGSHNTLDMAQRTLSISVWLDWLLDSIPVHRSESLSGVWNWNGVVVARVVQLYWALQFSRGQHGHTRWNGKITVKKPRWLRTWHGLVWSEPNDRRNGWFGQENFTQTSNIFKTTTHT